MRRSDRNITELQQIEDILAGARILHLGMHDGEYPYVVPMHYGYRLADGRLTLYVHCAREGHKLDCLRADDRVFAEIDCGEQLVPGETACQYGAVYRCIMARGRGVILTESQEKCEGLRLLMKTQTGGDYAFDARMADAVAVIRIDVESYTAKARMK